MDSWLNLSHLDHLGEEVSREGVTYRIVHIYAEAPDYNHVAGPEEGTACVDDAARAAIVYLRHFETTGDRSSQAKAEALLRFIMYMQRPDGLFYNFVLNKRLDINKTYVRSKAEKFEWWAARGVWALGTGARVLKNACSEFAKQCADHARLTLPHLKDLLKRYPETVQYLGRTIPTWLIYEDGADATSELLLGLVALNQAQPDPAIQTMITRFAEGLALMRYGSMNTFPYGAHASCKESWHAWGNSQTQALAEAGIIASAKLEAEHFYPRLLVENWLNAIFFDDLHAVQEYARIAYGVRCVAVGLIRLYEATDDPKYAIMAGLAAGWFTGNNAVGKPMYDPATGHGYDGLEGEKEVNYNAGAESTIEALFTILEAERHPLAKTWMQARGAEPTRMSKDQIEYYYRIFQTENERNPRRIMLLMNLTTESVELLEDEAIKAFLD